MADGGDARTQPRRELHFEVEYSVLSGRGELRLIKAGTLDFSLSGTRIETAEPLAEGDRLSVRIEVPELADFREWRVERKPFGTTVVMCFGQVRWISPSGEGAIRGRSALPGALGEQLRLPQAAARSAARAGRRERDCLRSAATS